VQFVRVTEMMLLNYIVRSSAQEPSTLLNGASKAVVFFCITPILKKGLKIMVKD